MFRIIAAVLLVLAVVPAQAYPHHYYDGQNYYHRETTGWRHSTTIGWTGLAIQTAPADQLVVSESTFSIIDPTLFENNLVLDDSNAQISPTNNPVVPEPTTFSALLIGFAIAARRRRS